ncbi:MAG: YfhO family protein [Oscillospiraceae bacterium]
MQTKKYNIRYLALALSPIASAAALLGVFMRFSLYPFGERTAAWCDMNQQVVPLLCQFKDILDGKSGMFLSFKNASGMNFLGVFFFFLSSPFTFLVKFVEKKDMLLFVNLLIVMKTAACAFTSSLYFVKSRVGKGLCTADIVILSFIYSLSGYVMLFYQNVIWLDMVYLFPLLLLSLERLAVRGRPAAYSALMAAMIIVNFYIGYMVVIFVLLISGAYVLFGQSKRSGAVCRNFLIGSAAAALASAAVWLPCFIQYLSSGRKSSLFDNLRTGSFVTDYDTVLPVVMSSSVLVIFAAEYLFFSKRTDENSRLLKAMSALMLIPLFIEPVNKMWHTGSYMSFPARYAFMTIFMLAIAASFILRRKYEYKADMKFYAAGLAICSLSAVLFERISAEYINADIDDLSSYTKTLGGSEASFKGMCRLFIAGALFIGVICLLYRKGWIFKGVFTVFLAAAVAIEACGYIRIYMTTSAERNEQTYAMQREVYNLSDRIEDDSFYRVKTSSKIFDYNMIGAMGYNSIGHYTSLTSEDYMFTMKRLGYTSVWMEVGTCGGTELTDAVLSVGYEISHEKDDSEVFAYDSYHILKKDIKLPLGIISADSFENSEIPSGLTRREVQQYLYESLFGNNGQLTAEFEPIEGEYQKTADGFLVSEGERLIYRIELSGEKSLYFDCFDKLTNNLSEPIYNSFAVRVNGKYISHSYPSSTENGVLYLGTFSDEKIIVEITALKDVQCASFGVFGVDKGRLSEECESVQTIGLTEVKNGLSGSVFVSEPQTVFLSVPYSDGLTVRVNGQKVSCRKALSAFTAFDIPKGNCSIEISFLPKGLVVGCVMSGVGVICIILLCVFGKRLENARLDKIDRISRTAALTIAAAVLLAVYIIPAAVNLLMWKKK